MSGREAHDRPATDPADLDEDLFDFPAEVELLGDVPGPSRPKAAGAARGSAARRVDHDFGGLEDELDAVAAELAAFEAEFDAAPGAPSDLDEDGDDERDAELDRQLDAELDRDPGARSPAAAERRGAGAATTAAELDDDLFDFPRVADPFAPQAFEDDDLGLGPDDMLIDADVDPELRSLVEDSAAAGKSDAPAPARAADPGTTDPVLPARGGASEPHVIVERVPVPAAAPPRGVLVLVALSLVANLALLAFTWRTGSSIREGLGDVGRALAGSFQEVRIQAAPPASSEPPEPIAEPRRLEPLEPAALETPERVQLSVAEEELAAGEPATARRRLYRLLATIDGISGPERDELEARATWLAAETYRAQARAVRAEGAR